MKITTDIHRGLVDAVRLYFEYLIVISHFFSMYWSYKVMRLVVAFPFICVTDIDHFCCPLYYHPLPFLVIFHIPKFYFQYFPLNSTYENNCDVLLSGIFQ